MQKTFTETFRLQSHQVDFNSRLKPGALLQMMQEMAGGHAEQLGIGHKLLLEKGLVWVLTRIEVQMARYPSFGEHLTIETFPMPNRRWFFPRYFVFRDEAGQQIGCASSMWVLLDVQQRRMCPPEAALPFIPDNSDLTAPMAPPAAVAIADGDPVCLTRLPLYSDLDMNGHVNNTRYLDWCCDALGVDTLKAQELSRFALNFNQEILPGQETMSELRRAGDAFSFSGFVDGVRHFDVGGTLRPRL